MTAIVPEGTRGNWRVSHFELDADAVSFANLRATIKGDRHLLVEPGHYAKLTNRGGVVMSDTLMERRSNAAIVENAEGHVLIAGLGLGMILWPILAKADATAVTVIEREADVISLVRPSLEKHPQFRKLTIVEADIFTWKPARGVGYDTIYFDIWPEINYTASESAKLHRRFRSRLVRGGWMGSWMGSCNRKL